MNVQRNPLPGRRYFFTVVTRDRRPILIDEIERLRAAFRRVKERHPFTLEAVVILPDHLHAMWAMPPDDADFSRRWSVLKRHFSAGLRAEPMSGSQAKKREKGVWQRGFWEHAIRNDTDWRRHLNYIHYNPVKHGYCDSPAAWPYSSFERFVKSGWYPADWAATVPPDIEEVSASHGVEGFGGNGGRC